MSGNKLFVDTNILIYFLRGDSVAIDLVFGKGLVISFITELELLSFGSISDEASETIKGFLKNCLIIDITPEIKGLTIEFRRKAKLKLPDAIIAATSFNLKMPLLTADKQFASIEELSVILYEA